LILTLSHSLIPKQKYYKDYPEYFDQWLRTWIIPVIRDYYKRHMEGISSIIPTYFIRYEDLITRPTEVLGELFCFLLNVPSIEGTVIEQRIA